MRTGLSDLATNILDQDVKTDMSWLFEIDKGDTGTIDYYLSTKRKSYNNIIYSGNPCHVGYIGGAGSPNWMNQPREIAISGNYAYIAGHADDSLVIFDISDPTAPSKVGDIRGAANKLNGAMGVAVSGNYAYVASYNDDALVIIDISTPSSPTLKGYIQGAGAPNYLDSAYDVAISGNYAYVCGYNNDSVVKIDISSPASPSKVDHIGDSTYLNGARNIVISGNYAYVAAYHSHGLAIIDLTTFTIVGDLRGSGSPNFLGNVSSLVVSGNYAYMTSLADDAVVIIDVSTPSSPSYVAHITGTGSPNYLEDPYGIDISGEHIFVTCGTDNSLVVINIANPSSPTKVAHIAGTGSPNYLQTAYNVKISGDYAYVTSLADDALTIFKISKIPKADLHVIDFTPIQLSRSKPEVEMLQTSAATVIQITNPGSALNPADFKDAAVTIRLIMEANLKNVNDVDVINSSDITQESSHVCETEICAWSFKCNRAWTVYQVLHLHCVDWLEQYLDGDYPKTPLISELWPAENLYAEDNVCVPKIWGTVYFPVRWVNTAAAIGNDYYVLGAHVAEDYHGIDEIRSPKEAGYDYIWQSGGTNITFSIVKKTADGDGNDYDLGKFVISDGGSNIFWNAGIHPDVPCKYKRTSTQNMTNPIRILKDMIEDMGVPSAKFNTASYNVARNTWNTRAMTWSVSLYKKEPCKVILARSLNMCNTRLIVRDELHFKVNDNDSQHTINSSWILRGKTGEGSFNFMPIVQNEKKDSGEVLYRESDLSIDNPTTLLVSMNSGKANVAKNPIDCTYITNEIHAQKIAIMALQRALLPDGRVTMLLKSKCLQLECGDIVTVEGANYNAKTNYEFLIDSMVINRDASVNVTGTTFRTPT